MPKDSANHSISFRRYESKSMHGSTRADWYSWLETASTEELQYLFLQEEDNYNKFFAQKQYADDFASVEAKYKEINEDDPIPIDNGYYYYSFLKEGDRHECYFRSRSLESPEHELLYDLNDLAVEHPRIWPGLGKPSPNNKLYAYLIDFDGSENYKLYLRDTENHTTIGPLATNVSNTFLEWSESSDSIYIVKIDHRFRKYAVNRIDLDQYYTTKEIYSEQRGNYHLSPFFSHDRNYLCIVAHDLFLSDILCIDLRSDHQYLMKSISGFVTAIDVWRENVILLINDYAARSQIIIKVNIGTKEISRILSDLHSYDDLIEWFSILRNRIILLAKKNMVPYLLIADLQDSSVKTISISNRPHSLSVYGNITKGQDHIMFIYTDFTTPYTFYRYNIEGETLDVLKETLIDGYNSSDYCTELVYALSEDGTKIPISLLYKRDVLMPTPTLSNVYGSYGHSIEPVFDINRLSLLDSGWIYAFIHVRGGGELGINWHSQALRENKTKSVQDYLASMDYLEENQYAAKGKLFAQGNSAGGFIIGSAINKRPELLNGVILDCPFVDILNSMANNDLPLSEGEYTEWGNPSQENEFHSIMNISPYENINIIPYPNIMLRIGLNDSRVPFWGPMKWLYSVKHNSTSNSMYLCKIDETGGHLDSTNAFDIRNKWSEEYEFLKYCAER